MRDWLQACREVKSFRFTASDEIGLLAKYHPRAMFENLAAHKASLERAWVSRNDFDEESDLPYAFVGSLKGFEKLEILCVDGFCLLDFDEDELVPRGRLPDVLPASLQVLAILRIEPGVVFDWTVPHLFQLISGGFLPELKVLCLDFAYDLNPERESCLAGLMKISGDLGVEVVMGNEDIMEYLDSIWPKSHKFDDQDWD